MKIHAYKVVPRGQFALGDVLEHISGLSLEERLRTVAEGDIRLEAGNRAGRFWTLDFGGIRPDGPGRASRLRPIVDFEMNEDEGFGQETAALYNTQSGFMTLQYNHFGPRHGRIQGYLFRFARLLAGLAEDVPTDDDHGFTLVPVLKRDAIERLNDANVIKNIDVQVFVPGILHADAARRRSFSAILNHPIFGNVESFQFRLAAPRRRGESLDVNELRRLATELLGLGDDVSTLQMTIKEAEEDPSEPLDLLDARLRQCRG